MAMFVGGSCEEVVVCEVLLLVNLVMRGQLCSRESIFACRRYGAVRSRARRQGPSLEVEAYDATSTASRERTKA